MTRYAIYSRKSPEDDDKTGLQSFVAGEDEMKSVCNEMPFVFSFLTPQ